MDTANALDIRNHLGEILDRLEKTGEPVLVSKGRQVRAVLITPEDFRRRFLDKQTEERRVELLDRIRSMRRPSTASRSSLDLLRELRGYQP
jgi:PHD/YefM family antitoxin component YafN of YafNO toxin-antitoxin module